MEFKFLPEKVKKVLSDAGAGDNPAAIFRSSGALDGSSGESYIVAYDGELCLLGRQLGSSYYNVVKGGYGTEVTAMNIVAGKFNSQLVIVVAGNEYKLKFSTFEEKDIKVIVELWKNSSGESALTPPPVPEGEASVTTGELNAFAALAAGMMYVAGVDDEIAESEERYIRRICGVRKDEFRAGVEFYNNNSLVEFQSKATLMSEDQKLCILANMLDLAMVDGVLHTSEQGVVQSFIDNTGLDKGKAGMIIDVLEIKNHTAVLIK
ncbi:MAG: TerB family tellurite resistance protein [Victivallaceae bacterium]|nr:TerB family tellurite resistance protein [Victivallaceae bacterium]